MTSMPLVRQLALERDRQQTHRSHTHEADEHAEQHVERSGLEHDRLEEEHGLEAFAVDAREAERGERQHLGADDSRRRRAQDPLLAPVQAGEVLVPVHPVVEPVEDHEQDADRDQRDDRLELLAVPRQRAQDRLRHDPGQRAGGQRGERAEEQRPPEAAAGPHEPGDERGEDQHGLQPLAKDDHRGVRDHGCARCRPGADGSFSLGERCVEALSACRRSPRAASAA